MLFCREFSSKPLEQFICAQGASYIYIYLYILTFRAAGLSFPWSCCRGPLEQMSKNG